MHKENSELDLGRPPPTVDYVSSAPLRSLPAFTMEQCACCDHVLGGLGLLGRVGGVEASHVHV